MARFKDESVPVASLQQQLQPGETLKHWGYGVKQPNIGLMIVLFALAILPGAIAVALLTKEYLVGLTENRLVVVQFSGGKVKVKEVLEYDLPSLKGKASGSKGSIFTHLKVKDESKPFTAKFHRMGAKQNKQHVEAIVDALAA